MQVWCYQFDTQLWRERTFEARTRSLENISTAYVKDSCFEFNSVTGFALSWLYIEGVKEKKAVLRKKQGPDGKLLNKETKAKLEAEITFLLYQDYLRTSRSSSEQMQGLTYGRDEHWVFQWSVFFSSKDLNKARVFSFYSPTKYSKLTLSSNCVDGHTLNAPPIGFRLQPLECHSAADGSSCAREMRFPRTRPSNEIAAHATQRDKKRERHQNVPEPGILNMTHWDYRGASGSVRLQHVFFGKDRTDRLISPPSLQFPPWRTCDWHRWFLPLFGRKFALLFLCPPTVFVYWNGLLVDRKQQAAMALNF